MKNSKKSSIILVIIILMLTMMTACGVSGTSGTATIVTSDEAATTESIAEETESLPTEDPDATEDSVIGNWIQSDNAERFANISKNESGFVYEDPEGIYYGTFDKGVLTVKVNETEIAKVYFDKIGNRLVMKYQEVYTYFTKK